MDLKINKVSDGLKLKERKLTNKFNNSLVDLIIKQIEKIIMKDWKLKKKQKA